MKKTLICILLIFLISDSFSQNQAIGVTKIKIYMVKWYSHYHIVRNIENIKETYLYFFKMKDNELAYYFDSYTDCISKLKSQDTVSHKYNSCNICVELFFKKKKLSVYFKNNGEYYFDGQWYKINSGFYYNLFSYFSEELIPPETLNKAKQNANINFWIKNN